MGYQINNQQVIIPIFSIDEHYFSTLGINLVEGVNFSADSKENQEGIIVNETLAQLLGRDSTGKINPLMGEKIIGVAQDHHYASLESKIEPLIFSYSKDAADYILIKVRPKGIPGTLQAIEKPGKILPLINLLCTLFWTKL
jgi:putative ABC transport system permease protein